MAEDVAGLRPFEESFLILKDRATVCGSSQPCSSARLKRSVRVPPEGEKVLAEVGPHEAFRLSRMYDADGFFAK
jgi:hypothetical protein